MGIWGRKKKILITKAELDRIHVLYNNVRLFVTQYYNSDSQHNRQASESINSKMKEFLLENCWKWEASDTLILKVNTFFDTLFFFKGKIQGAVTSNRDTVSHKRWEQVCDEFDKTVTPMFEELTQPKTVGTAKPDKQPSPFPEFNLDELKPYAGRWAKKYSILNIRRIALCRYDSGRQTHSLGMGILPHKYVLVFILPSSQGVDLSTIESYAMEGESENMYALKGIMFADQFASQGEHRLFDRVFPNTAYKHIPDGGYYREWKYELTKDETMNDVPNIHVDEMVVLWEG